tara:strand:+ start:1199 stop:2305 length:1107 start_codon:yes stop_codon:yes gene_type:complete
MITNLNTGVKNVRNVSRYNIGIGALKELSKSISYVKKIEHSNAIFLIDDYFENNNEILNHLDIRDDDQVYFIQTKDEPSTDYINQLYDLLLKNSLKDPAVIIGMGGGLTMDVAKAISNLITNGGKSEDYQGWDLLKKPGIYKVGVPTISGTGSEATRTCVLTNKKTGLKLGMNSDFTVFDQLILDPELTKTVPKNQYFYTGMDAYIHCIESLNGSYRNPIGDSYSQQTINLCREIFMSNDMMSEENRSKLMVASYLGGCAIATSYVGVIHPFSAGLSVVLNIHHCVANCITMRAMSEFYPKEYAEFWEMVERQNIEIPKNICQNLTDDQYTKLYESTIIHDKPLTNALGVDFQNILTKDKVIELFKEM